jgi:hypothetical protein
MYSYNLENEKAPSKKILLNQGPRILTIIGGNEAISKKGNNMFVFEMEELETKHVEKVYCILEEGKRWVLKQILDSINVQKDSSGNYSWDLESIIGKKLLGVVIHEDTEFINRDGNTIKTKRHKIIEFKKYTPNQTAPGSIEQLDEAQWKD